MRSAPRRVCIDEVVNIAVIALTETLEFHVVVRLRESILPIDFAGWSAVDQLIFSRLLTMQMMVIRNSNYLVHARGSKALDIWCELVYRVWVK